MSTAIPTTANQHTVAQYEEKRLTRLVAASRKPDAKTRQIDEVLQARFHASHLFVVAFVRYVDDTCGLVFGVYHGDVRIEELQVSGVVHRALQITSPKVGLRLEPGMVHVAATDVYGQSQTCELTLPEL